MQIKKYCLGKTEAWYLINEKGNVFLHLLPADMSDELKNPWEYSRGEIDMRGKNPHAYDMGSLAYFQLAEEAYHRIPITLKNQPLMGQMLLDNHECKQTEDKTIITTTLKSEKGYYIVHSLTYIKGLRGFFIETEFINNSNKTVTLEMLSSFSLDNLSPYQQDDASGKYLLHRFMGGWSLEGKHTCQTAEELGLERTWASWNCGSMKFGSKGSYPTGRYFPTAAVEDKEAGVIWAARIAHNATWQMELSRFGDNLSFSGGLGDSDFCGWQKLIKQGEGFKAPTAHIAVVTGDIYDACNALNDMQKIAYNAYGEAGLGICFNEYCTIWGKPTQQKMLGYLDTLKELGVKYAVIDAGWSKQGSEQDSNGEWLVDKNIFPDIKELCRVFRENGIIPGIWFEWEVTTKGSKMFEGEYDDMHLKRDGRVINLNNFRSFWDLRRDDVKEYLRERVIGFLKKYGFGYIKVDYNGNTGIIADGAESGAEGLREHLSCVRDFFVEMRNEIPDLIIENCASGGHRAEPSMTGISAVTSMSDAHEPIEIPYIAADMQYQILPAQSLIWAVLHSDDSMQREVYTLTATFLGRMCLSGQIDELNTQQKHILKAAIEFYKKLENIIINGSSKLYGNRGSSTHNPTGTQIVVRKTDTEILVVYHAFKNSAGKFEIDIPDGFEISDNFYAYEVSLLPKKLVIDIKNDFSAGAAFLTKE